MYYQINISDSHILEIFESPFKIINRKKMNMKWENYHCLFCYDYRYFVLTLRQNAMQCVNQYTGKSLLKIPSYRRHI